MAKKLSKGLEDLLNNIEAAPVRVTDDGERVYNIPVESIARDPKQPRKSFDDVTLNELSESIKNHGILQPITVKQDGDKFQIIAGERRYRAAILAGLTSVPALVRNLDAKKSREASLVENLQREDLNAIEEAEALQELLTHYNLTQELLAARIGKSRPNVANTLRLLKLSDTVKDYVRTNRLSAGHARALLQVTNEKRQNDFAVLCLDDKMSVRDLEKKIRFYLHPELLPKPQSAEDRAKLSAEMKELLTDMSRIFGTKVKAMGNDKKGRIYIDYYTKDDLDRIYDLMERLK